MLLRRRGDEFAGSLSLGEIAGRSFARIAIRICTTGLAEWRENLAVVKGAVRVKDHL